MGIHFCIVDSVMNYCEPESHVFQVVINYMYLKTAFDDLSVCHSNLDECLFLWIDMSRLFEKGVYSNKD